MLIVLLLSFFVLELLVRMTIHLRSVDLQLKKQRNFEAVVRLRLLSIFTPHLLALDYPQYNPFCISQPIFVTFIGFFIGQERFPLDFTPVSASPPHYSPYPLVSFRGDVCRQLLP